MEMGERKFAESIEQGVYAQVRKYRLDGSRGFSYLLYNNVRGTNYPLWYRDNAAA